jgi:hypothetical protein
VKLRLAGFLLTIAVVLVLLGSLVAGLRSVPAESEVVPHTSSPRAPVVLRERVRVEVLNGAGVPGLARDVTRDLRAAGFDVVYYGNATRSDQDSTLVIDRIGNPAAAAAVAAALGVMRVETALDTTLYLEATVVLGRDAAP